MIWVGIAAGVGVVSIGALVVLAARVRAYRLTSPDEPTDGVDPLFASGITLAGAGVALALTIGPFMYLIFVVGMVLMAVGAYRTRNGHPGHGS